MRLFFRDDHGIRLSLLGVIATLLLTAVAAPLGFLSGLRNSSADTLVRWRSQLSTPPPQKNDILLIAVDDESQRRLNQKWPWDRALFAQLLARLKNLSPRLILLDFAFVGESSASSDLELARAVGGPPPVLLAAYLDAGGQLMLPEKGLVDAGGIPALINKPLDSDSVVRRLWTKLPLRGEIGPPEGIEFKAATLVKETSWKELPAGPLGDLYINYFIPAEKFHTVSFWKILQEKVDLQEVRDKLVIIGSSREITHDVHETPLGRMPGMILEANGLLTFLTERPVKTLPFWLVLTVGLLTSIGILHLAFRTTIATGLIGLLAGCAGLAGGGYWLTLRDYRVELFLFILTAFCAWIIGILYKYGELLLGIVRLHRQVSRDPFTGGLTHHFFLLQAREELRRLTPLFQWATLALIQVAPPSRVLHEKTWQEVRDRFRELAGAIQKHLPAKSLFGRLQDNRIAILLFDSPAAARKKMEEIRQATSSFGEIQAWGLAGSEGLAPLSVENLIRCAETALLRAQGKEALIFYDPAVDRVELEKEKEGGTSSASEQELGAVASEMGEKEKALEKSLVELRKAHQEMESAFLEVTKSLVLALETKDAYTAGHLERVSRYATRLAQEMHLAPEQIEAIREAALLHDIGKIGLPDEVLHKVGPLTDQERDVIKEHLTLGAKILEPMRFFRPITTLIYHHHERYDGKGYPHGLSGEFIPPGAQIITIADSFDAMTTHRGYNKAKTIQEAVAELKAGAGTQFNPIYVEKFAQIIEREGPQLAGYTAG